MPKKTYAVESYDIRINAGMAVCIDILNRSGYQVAYAGKATVHLYDIVMVSITSDCDWWPFVAERIEWQHGSYKVVVGGQGVLNVRPFLAMVDYFVLGRAEGVLDRLVAAIDYDLYFVHPSVIASSTFSADKDYTLNQVAQIYPYDIILPNQQTYHEDVIGCNHRCLFCGYTWHRKNIKQDAFSYSGLWNGGVDRERAMIDIANGIDVNMVKLRTTAIDGTSERLRRMVNKRITREMLRGFIDRAARCKKPHQIKIYNIIGYPTETHDDWMELISDMEIVDAQLKKQSRQTCLLIHNTPFRAMPATPTACWPMSYRNYRGELARVLGGGRYKGNILYQGNAIWSVESMGTESLPTVAESAIMLRGTESDTDNIIGLSASKKYWKSSMAAKQATIEQYFDVDKLFGAFDPARLPTKYLKSYANVEKMWK